MHTHKKKVSNIALKGEPDHYVQKVGYGIGCAHRCSEDSYLSLPLSLSRQVHADASVG
jgi:hypothetical protein